MNLTTTRSDYRSPLASLSKTRVQSSAIFSLIIILAMFAFEAFNYSTTAYALRDLLGDLKFAGVSWATLMALAFCGIDFAGIARLITQKTRPEAPRESWYLFGAWLLAAAFNAALTWWGVSLALASHTSASAGVVNTRSLTTVVPVLVAIMVWVIRILIIGSLSSALEKTNRPGLNSVSKPQVNTTAGFPTATRTAAPAPRPFSSPVPSHTPASRMEVRPAYKPRPAVGTPSRQNDFMAAESRTRDL